MLTIWTIRQHFHRILFFQFGGPPFQNGTPEIHPENNSYEIGWFNDFF